MIQDELIYQILQDFGFEPTHDQRNALQTFAQFMTDRRDNAVMILRGSAGTGKTSLAGAIKSFFAIDFTMYGRGS